MLPTVRGRVRCMALEISFRPAKRGPPDAHRRLSSVQSVPCRARQAMLSRLAVSCFAAERESLERRDPEPEGYAFWLDVLNNRETGNYRGMICSFITSTEYQRRFSSVVTHGNAECSQ